MRRGTSWLMLLLMLRTSRNTRMATIRPPPKRSSGIALRNRDSSIVACSDDGELDRVRERWCRGKLGLAQKQPEIDAAIQAVCEKMKAEGGQKSRVTFYYLLAEHFGKLDALAG